MIQTQLACTSRTPSRKSDIDALLHDKPPALRSPVFLRFAELQVVVHEQRGYQLRPAFRFRVSYMSISHREGQ